MVSKSGKFPKAGRLSPRKKHHGNSKVIADPTDVWEDHGSRPESSEKPTEVKSVPKLETSGIQKKTTMLASEHRNRSSFDRTSKNETTGNQVRRQVRLFETLSSQTDGTTPPNQAKKHSNKASKTSDNKTQKEMTLLDDLVSALAQAVDGRDEDSIVSSRHCRRDQMQKSKTKKKGGANKARNKSSCDYKPKNRVTVTVPGNDNSFMDSEITDTTDSMSIYSAKSGAPACGNASKFMEGMCYCQILDCLNG